MILKTRVFEKIDFEKAEKNSEANTIEILYFTTKEFNISKGRMEKVTGAIIVSTDKKSEKPSTTRLSLKLKE